MAPTRRMTDCGVGKMRATFDRRLISLFSRSRGFALCSWKEISDDRPVRCIRPPGPETDVGRDQRLLTAGARQAP